MNGLRKKMKKNISKSLWGKINTKVYEKKTMLKYRNGLRKNFEKIISKSLWEKINVKV